MVFGGGPLAYSRSSANFQPLHPSFGGFLFSSGIVISDRKMNGLLVVPTAT